MMEPAGHDARPHTTLWMLDLGQPLPVGPVPRIHVTFTCAGVEIAEELAQVMGLDARAVVARFDQGRQCYVGIVDGRIAAYAWVTCDAEDIGELSLGIRLNAGEAYIWNCATLPAYRGQHLYPALLTYTIGELHRQNVHRIWICTDTDNLPSQRGVFLAGLQPIGDIFSSRTRRLRHLWLRGRPDVDQQMIADACHALLGGREEIWLATTTDGRPAGMIHPHLGQPLILAGEPIESARAAMIMLHGRGASAQDILIVTTDLHWSGFISLAPQAYSNRWYPNSFTAPAESNEPDLSSALAVITALLDQLAQAGIPTERTILLGFSQGACLALEYVARNPRRYGGVVGLSGGLIGPDVTRRDFSNQLLDTPVFLGCSDVDPYIPQERVEQTTAAFRLLGGDVTLRFYPHMDHTVNQDELSFIQRMMDRVLATGD